MQNAIKNGVDPYVHLVRYFTEDELHRARCFDDHSKAQVDYLIALRDPIGLCSDALRGELYKIFKVAC